MAEKIYIESLLPLFQKFISESENGKRLQKNGKLIKKSTIENYKALQLNLIRFKSQTNSDFLINTNYKYSKQNFIKTKNYYAKFYKQFTDFLYSRKCTDNYVGMLIKILRSFFIYLDQTKGFQIGPFYKDFYSRKEDVPIVIVSQDRLHFLIYDSTFSASLPSHLSETKEVFVIGCTVGLRFSDLMALTWRNIHNLNGNIYVVTKSIKTGTDTRIKLPIYAVEILNKYKRRKGTIFRPISLNQFNKNVKKIGEMALWIEEIGKVRSQRGQKKEVKFKGNSYRFCDLMTSHTMRRTAITTMLMLGMPEPLVRKVSGHSSNSKDFSKYVKYSESFLDAETDKVFDKLALKG